MGNSIKLTVRRDGNLYVIANRAMQEYLTHARQARNDFESTDFERAVLNPFLARYHWITPEQLGALTSAPILGTYNARGQITRVWYFADYAIRGILNDLADYGSACMLRAKED